MPPMTTAYLCRGLGLLSLGHQCAIAPAKSESLRFALRPSQEHTLSANLEDLSLAPHVTVISTGKPWPLKLPIPWTVVRGSESSSDVFLFANITITILSLPIYECRMPFHLLMSWFLSRKFCSFQCISLAFISNYFIVLDVDVRIFRINCI